MFRLLVIDNYDSFTYNLIQMFMPYDLGIHVHRADMISLDQAQSLSPDYILISPGPRDPAHSGVSVPVVKYFSNRIPILGVCLGMQCINEAFGGRTINAPYPVHGKTCIIRHDGLGPFKGIPSPFMAARYHSLITKPDNNSPLITTCQSLDNIIMGLSHPFLPVHGIQFHPESFMTEHGHLIIENFLKMGPLGKEENGHD